MSKIIDTSKIKIIFLIGIFLTVTWIVSVSAATIVLDSEKQFNYAKKCFDGKDYIAAIVEFKKFTEMFPENEKVKDAEFFIGMSWFNGGKFGEAIRTFEELINMDRDYRTAWFTLAECHVKSGNPVMAEIVLDTYIKIVESEDEKDQARNRIGWIRFETAKWEKAESAFLSISDTNKAKFKVSDMLGRIEKAKELELKSPAVAGTFAALPGAGYLYTGRYQDAFISFLLNGAFIYGAYEAFDHEQYALGGVVSFVGFGFYSGSIYGSVSAAHKYNRKVRRHYINQTRNDITSGFRVGIFPDMKKKGLAVAFGFRF